MLRLEDKERLEGAFADLQDVSTPNYNAFNIGDFDTLYATWSEVLELDENGIAIIPAVDAVKMLVDARRSVVNSRKYEMIADAIESAAFDMAAQLPIKIDEQFTDRML